MERKNYLPPQIEVFGAVAERGFAGTTVEGGVDGFDREVWNE